MAKSDNAVVLWDNVIKTDTDRYEQEDILMNFVTNHDENSWNGTIYERMKDASELLTALSFVAPGMPLIYSGQEYDLNKRLRFFEKDSFPKTTGSTMKLLQQLGALKNNHPALESGKEGGSFRKLPTTKENQVYAFERGKEEEFKEKESKKKINALRLSSIIFVVALVYVVVVVVNSLEDIIEKNFAYSSCV